MGQVDDLAQVGWKIRQQFFGSAICFTYPVATETISVTGPKCELNCAHCGGHYLQHMKSLDSINQASDIQGKSCLISGGCGADGGVPLAAVANRLQELKQERRYNLHVGLVDASDIDKLAAIADMISFDFVGDTDTIHEVFGTTRTVEDYVACYKLLRQRCQVMPHICIGLRGGKISGEYQALELLRQLGTDGLTFIVFTPTKGTIFANRQPPELTEVIELFVKARQMFPDIPLHLGCLRPRGRYRTELDQWAVKSGLNTLVNPTPAAVRLAESLGLTMSRGEECCSL
jgi:uncharacterized radical SAM superfamily protein